MISGLHAAKCAKKAKSVGRNLDKAGMIRRVSRAGQQLPFEKHHFWSETVHYCYTERELEMGNLKYETPT